MPANVVHFAVHVDDTERARRFYERVLGWRFDPWGPPGFFKVRTGDDDAPGIEGALHDHRGEDRLRGFECTVAVEDLDAVRAAVVAEGGEILHEQVDIPGTGSLVQFRDTEGNGVSAMRYDDGRR